MKQLFRVGLPFALILGSAFFQNSQFFKTMPYAEGPARSRSLRADTSVRFFTEATQSDQLQPRTALKGQSGAGEEITRQNTVLIINLNPCGRMDPMSFRPPYDEEYAGEMYCGGRKITLIAVTQK